MRLTVNGGFSAMRWLKVKDSTDVPTTSAASSRATELNQRFVQLQEKMKRDKLKLVKNYLSVKFIYEIPDQISGIFFKI